MIPYFQLMGIDLGPITIQAWGTMVALGIITGILVSARYAKSFGISSDLIHQGGFWIIVGAMIGGRLFHVFAYEPGFYLTNVLEIFKVWNGGMSVMGGYIGAVIAYGLFTRIYSIDWLKHLDKFIFGLPIGLGIGRLGCFFIHDHPGKVTNFFLAVQRPDGLSAIHDHGLYLSINGFILALVFFLLAKKQRPDGFFARFFLIWYGAVRFFLDFLRIADSTYFGLTPAQYVGMIMFLAGICWSVAVYAKKIEAIK